MAKMKVTVWSDSEGDYLEVMFQKKTGFFRQTSNDQVMKKFDTKGHLLGFSVLNPDFALGARTETNEALPTAETFPTKKGEGDLGHRTNFLRTEKSGIVRRIPRPNAKSRFKSFCLHTPVP
jgi:hypothetical protein